LLSNQIVCCDYSCCSCCAMGIVVCVVYWNCIWLFVLSADNPIEWYDGKLEIQTRWETKGITNWRGGMTN